MPSLSLNITVSEVDHRILEVLAVREHRSVAGQASYMAEQDFPKLIRAKLKDDPTLQTEADQKAAKRRPPAPAHTSGNGSHDQP